MNIFYIIGVVVVVIGSQAISECTSDERDRPEKAGPARRTWRP
jgi:hypothetical protein